MASPAVFISYAVEDSATVLALARELRALDHPTWTFEEDGAGGVSYVEDFYAALCQCPAFLLMASKVAVRSAHVRKEVELAYTEERVVIPVLLDLTVEELRRAHDLFKVVIGTTVPLVGSGTTPRELAARVDAALAKRGIARHQPAAPSGSAHAAAESHNPFFHSLADRPPMSQELKEVACLWCNGSGKWASVQKPGKWNTCKKCGGTGRIKFPTSKFPSSLLE